MGNAFLSLPQRGRGTAIAVDEESHIQKPSGCEFSLIGKKKIDTKKVI